jgi:hypothetical protein
LEGWGALLDSEELEGWITGRFWPAYIEVLLVVEVRKTFEGCDGPSLEGVILAAIVYSERGLLGSKFMGKGSKNELEVKCAQENR